MIVDLLIEFIKADIFPNVNAIGNDLTLMKQAFKKFIDLEFYKLLIPENHGGVGLSAIEKIKLQESMGMYGGALAFLQVQLWAPIWLLSISNNISLAEKCFKEMIENRISIGNSLYQLKPENSRYLTCKKSNDGFYVSGKINFATGYGIFDYIIVGFIDESTQQELVGLLPFNNKGSTKNQFHVGETLTTVTMLGIGTVSLELKDYFIPNENILHIWERNVFYGMLNQSSPSAYTIGIAKAALELIRVSAVKSNKFEKTYTHFYNQLNNLKEDLALHVSGEDGSALAAKILHLAWEVLQFVALVLGGASCLSAHPYQRLLQEALIWLSPRNNLVLAEFWCDIVN